MNDLINLLILFAVSIPLMALCLLGLAWGFRYAERNKIHFPLSTKSNKRMNW